ncbi:MAG: SUMF1/EgtB/PvdO family nonheme iron enzyme, partial [Vulcanimicrobiota bacterium]
YLPPENYRAGLFGKSVDAWALGICVHLAQCGRLPYSGEGNELLEQVLKNPPRIERLSGRSGTVVRHLLAQEAEQRWGSQQCIDHITRPRDSAFGTAPDSSSATAELRASGRLGPYRGPGEEAPQTVSTLDTRPLYLRPPFFVVCALCFIALTFIGWKRARLPDVPKENAPPDALYSIDFSHTQVDPDGRIITKKPEQSTAYSEELGSGVRIEMVAITPGVFEMGSDPNEPYHEKSEGPKHPVQVGGFFISRFEITQQQWKAVAAAPKISVDLPEDPSAFTGPDRPVERVTWVQAKEFCNRLSSMTGRLYRLPTEAEWEFACRAGTDTPFCFGKTMNSALANYQASKPFALEGKGEYRRETIPVGSLGAANYFGLLDVHGNVSEWCEDRFGEYPDAFIVEPTGPKTGEDRVVRGGSWKSFPWECRSSSRSSFNKDYQRNDIGFRIVLPRVVMVPAEG